MKPTFMILLTTVTALGATFAVHAQEDIHQDVVLKADKKADKMECPCCKKMMNKDNMAHDKDMNMQHHTKADK